MKVRLAHLSDVHLTVRPLGWKINDLFTKRLSGWMNFHVSRKKRFHLGEAVVEVLVHELKERRPDRVVFSGDATVLGFESEIARAATALNVETLPGLAVPGNHDYYTPRVASSGIFEKYFSPWQEGERVGNSVYPFAQRVGPLWLIGVNSCTGNRWSWDAGGTVDRPQLDRLKTLLTGLSPGPRILVTHYPVVRSSGKREGRSHGLRNLDDLIQTAADGGVCLWLHGHRHGPYFFHQPGGAPFPVICAGSATQDTSWSYGDYTVEGSVLHAVRRVFCSRSRRFHDRESFEIHLARA